MQKQTETSEKSRFSNTDRDEGTLGVSGNRKNDPGLANEGEPPYGPPEGQPEPRPPEPIMNSNPNSSPSRTNTNSPA